MATPVGVVSLNPKKLNVPLQERERLYPDIDPRLTAFSPRPETRLATARSPANDTKISLNHTLRTFREESTIIYPLPSYQTWIDAGNLDPLIPDHPDPEYNANAWRHFSSREGVRYSTEGRRVSALVASMYPLNIPPPSRMGNFTYAHYIKNGDIFRDPLLKQKKITRTEKEVEEMTRLKIMSDARVPPTDDKGRILPPLTFRRLKAQGRIKYYPMNLSNQYQLTPHRTHPLSGVPRDQHSDTASLASRNTSLRHKGLLWKFSYKLNNPEYDRVLETQKEKERWRRDTTRMRILRKKALQQELLASY